MTLLSKRQLDNVKIILGDYLSAPQLKNGHTPKESCDEFDKKRIQIIEHELKPLLSAYLRGSLELSDFKYRINIVNANNRLWGFNGTSGQMFFNVIFNRAKDLSLVDEFDHELKSALLVPKDDEEASNKLINFELYLKDFCNRCFNKGYDKNKSPKIGNVPFFLSYFWQIQEKDRWPVYYFDSREAMSTLNIWSTSGNIVNDYLIFKHIHEELIDLFSEHAHETFNLYKVEHVLQYRLKNPVITTIVEDENLRGSEYQYEKPANKNPDRKTTVETWDSIKTKLSINFIEIDFDLSDLYFEPEQKKSLFSQISNALRNGKHIIFLGPPGTGKSKLAKSICEFYNSGNYCMCTATSDWSTFETIGGYRLDEDNSLKFFPGIFLKCFQNDKCEPSNTWLIIDEINRADIDKAFGSLFSALTGDNVTLPFKKGINHIKIIGSPQESTEIEDGNFIVPQDWRIIATMNTFDKSSLYEMSYAFMRRFAFIPVDVPPKITYDIVKNYIKCWVSKDEGQEIESELCNNLSELWTLINSKRKIGPAIIRDIYNYVYQGDDYTSALILYVLPQFEGLMEEEQTGFINSVSKLNFLNDSERLKSFASDFFGIDPRRFKSNETSN